MILDNPIGTEQDDRLNRISAAKCVAEEINRFCSGDSTESLVVGIEGEWGSGKTSFINLVLENLESSDALVIKFNPWNFSDQDELITDFFNSIANSIANEPRQAGKKYGEIIQSMKNYFPRLLKRGEFAIAPEISLLGLKFKMGTVYKAGGGDTLEEQKKEINKLLKNIEKRIIIVVDDIDRLDMQETRLVFKLVKMTANFANTIFLLAYDPGKVAKMIGEKGILGEEFLKKIVQLRFPLPTADRQDLFNILSGELEKIIEGFNENLWDQDRWEDIYESGLKNLFPTVRDINRYINSLRIDLKIINENEVNPVDFLGIEAIRVFAPDVYFNMAREKRTFAFPAADNIYSPRIRPLGLEISGFIDDPVEGPSRRRDICEEIIKRSPEGLSGTITEIIKELFPQVDDLYSDNPSNDWDQGASDWTQQLRVCSGDVFDKYFSLFIGPSVLSEKDLKDFLAEIEDRHGSVEKLENFWKEGKLNLLDRRLCGSLGGSSLSVRQLESLLVVFFDFEETAVPVDVSNPYVDYTLGLGRKILEIIPREDRLESLVRILDSTKDIGRSTAFIDIITSNPEETTNENWLTGKEFSDLNKICLERIEKAAENGSLRYERQLNFVLPYWKKQGSEEQVKGYVAELIETEDGLFCLLKAHFQGVSFRESIQRIADIEKVDKKVMQLDVNNLEEWKAEIINSYRR